MICESLGYPIIIYFLFVLFIEFDCDKAIWVRIMNEIEINVVSSDSKV